MISDGNRFRNRPPRPTLRTSKILTKQEFQFDADPNTLMKAFSKTGKKELLIQTEKIALHGDFSEVPDFFSALLQVQEVTEEYDQLPIEIRRATHHSPNELFELMSDPKRIDLAIELGLRPPKTTKPLEIPTAPSLKTEPGSSPDSPIQGGE